MGNNWLTGFLIFFGILTYSPQAALTAFVGAVIGTLVAILIGQNAEEILDGLWAYNSALTALAVSVLFVPLGGAYAALVLGGAAAATLATLAAKVFFGKACMAPCLTLPSC